MAGFKKKIIRLAGIKQGGFTLLEMLVAISVFGIVIIIIAGIFSMSLKSQRKALAISAAQESARYLLESMTKEIRMSTINTGASSGAQTINITNPHLETFDYSFDSGGKRLLRGGQVISPDNVEIDGRFYIEANNYPSWAKITIVMDIRTKGNYPE